MPKGNSEKYAVTSKKGTYNYQPKKSAAAGVATKTTANPGKKKKSGSY